MSFLNTLSRKLGFSMEDADERDEEIDENELDEEDEEDEEEEEQDSRFSFKFSNPFKMGASSRVQDGDDEEDEDESPADAPNRSRRGNVIHDSRMDNRYAQEPQFTHCERIVNVRQIEECRDIIKFLLRGESVLLNLENIDPKDCGRVVDMLSGAAFALRGRMLKVAHLSYLLAPENVEVIEEDLYAAAQHRYR